MSFNNYILTKGLPFCIPIPKPFYTIEGLPEYTKQSVKVDQEKYTTVKAYGLGFAPYFMSLSLWVGDLMLLVELFYDLEDRFKIFSRNNKNKIQRTFAYIGLACIQAIVLGIFLKLGLGYEVENYFLYFGCLMLISIAFISIMETLIVHFDDIGKFFGILFLVLQLAASGGTFPIETVPNIFRNIYNFMPMKYSIALIKQSVVKIDANILGKNLIVIIAIIIVFGSINIITDIVKMRKEK